LELLPSAFTLTAARQAGVRKDQVYRGVQNGQIQRVGRGAYVKADSLDVALAGLAAATAVKPLATMCLTSALVHHGLSDAIPPWTDVALPRGTRHPAGFEHVVWHSFDRATFGIGRESLEGTSDLFSYSPERTIIDCFRLAHQEGQETAIEALKRWLRLRGNYPAKLAEMAKGFPKAYPSIHSTLKVLS
jgi:predicted transcriptional regulator of viral defense system